MEQVKTLQTQNCISLTFLWSCENTRTEKFLRFLALITFHSWYNSVVLLCMMWNSFLNFKLHFLNFASLQCARSIVLFFCDEICFRATVAMYNTAERLRIRLIHQKNEFYFYFFIFRHFFVYNCNLFILWSRPSGLRYTITVQLVSLSAGWHPKRTN